MDKLAAFWNLFRKGEELANAATWKNRQLIANVLVAVAAVAQTFGLNVGLSDQDAMLVGGAVLVLVNCVLTVITSRKVGVLPARLPGPDQAKPQSPFDDARGA